MSRPTLEEEKRRDQVLKALSDCDVLNYDADVIDTLSRWLAQESKAALQDKKSELTSGGVLLEDVPQLILESIGIGRSLAN